MQTLTSIIALCSTDMELHFLSKKEVNYGSDLINQNCGAHKICVKNTAYAVKEKLIPAV